MRIKISFYDSADYTSEAAENFIRHDNVNHYMLEKIGGELKDILIEDYFNGADNAVIYMGYSLAKKEFEYGIMPG